MKDTSATAIANERAMRFKRGKSTEDLQGEIALLEKELGFLQSIVDEREAKELLPRLRKKFVGMYFLEECDGRKTYQHCTKILDKYYCIVDHIFFEDNIWIIRTQHKTHVTALSSTPQITRREYLDALKKFKSQLEKLAK